jgi:hypothetical protein
MVDHIPFKLHYIRILRFAAVKEQLTGILLAMAALLNARKSPPADESAGRLVTDKTY